LTSGIETLPQVLINVAGVDRARVHTDAEVVKAADDARAALGDGGRVLLRASGTEPLIRVMVEATTEADATRHAQAVASVVSTRLAL
jgi:phosphoglucosamine mutase